MFQSLEKTIGIDFKDKVLLKNIFVHRSYLNEHKNYELPSNEKLEFLGDSVLSLTTSIYLYQKYPELAEGDYTDIKASIVRTESLAEVAGILNLGPLLMLSKGEEAGHGRSNINILADCFEALIAGIFIDQGFDEAYKFIVKFLFSDKLNNIVKNELYSSPKSRLQEHLQSKFKILPQYKVTKEEGPEHDKMFEIDVYFNKEYLGKGFGKSKKRAEEAAALEAIKTLGI